MIPRPSATSPSLAASSWLRSQFGEIWIPGAVKCELERLHQVARLLRASLDPGEVEAIAFALELQADLIPLAERAGLRMAGVLGVLLRAKESGQVESIARELDALRTRARFFVSPASAASLLKAARE